MDNGHPPAAAAATDAVAVVTLVLGQMTMLESRLGQKIDRIEASATGAWKTHEAEHASMDKALTAIGHRLDDHLRREEEEELIFEARIDPIRKATLWAAREWRTIAVIMLIVVDLIAQLRQMIGF